MSARVPLVDSGEPSKLLSDFVLLTGAQTLTGKTLAFPTLTAPTISGTVTATGATVSGGALVPAQIKAPTATPVNAAAATGTLTLAGNPTAGHTVTIGGRTYTWVDNLSVSGVKALAVLTLSDVAEADDTTTINGVEYTWVAALTGAAASSTLTLANNLTDGNRIVIGSTTYTLRETLAQAYDVLIGVDASATLDNLIAAINKAAGEGSTYGTGTVAHPTVSAAAGAGDTATITAKAPGVAGNAIATLEYGAAASWTGATLSGGADTVANEVLVEVTAEACINNLVAAATGGSGAGTKYSTGTEQPDDVEVSKGSAATIEVEALAAGTAGNSIAVAEDMANGAWDHATLNGGVDAVAEAADTVLVGASASDTIDNLIAAINGAAGEGSTYGTGTAVHADVAAAAGAGDTMTITAKTRGAAGNAIATTENDSNTSWGDTTLLGGVNGTLGDQWDIKVDASYLYVCVAANGVTGQNWRRVSLGTAY
jgi:hypothetical protein